MCNKNKISKVILINVLTVSHVTFEHFCKQVGSVSGLEFTAGQQIVVTQHAVQPPSTQAVLVHVGSTVEVVETCTTDILHVSAA